MPEYGSLINMIAATTTRPEVGKGATLCGWTDRHAGTIVRVSASGKVVDWQEDTATRTDGNGMSDCQSYDYTPNPDAPVKRFSRRNDGQFREVGGSAKLLIGVRAKYHDYSF